VTISEILSNTVLLEMGLRNEKIAIQTSEIQGFTTRNHGRQ
jgi:hypothetical protein